MAGAVAIMFELRPEAVGELLPGVRPLAAVRPAEAAAPVDLAAERLGAPLATVHARLVRARFDPAAFASDIHGAPGRGYLTARTPAGRRTFAPFRLCEFGRPGGAAPVAGVPLCGGYLPTWVDWRHEAGASAVLALREDTLAMIDEARRALAAVIPQIADAATLLVATDA